MKLVTFDGKYELVTDETPQGCYVLLLPTNDWLGNGFILNVYPSSSEAHAALRELAETYARRTTQGFNLEQSPVGLRFSHVDGHVVPLVADDRHMEQQKA